MLNNLVSILPSKNGEVSNFFLSLMIETFRFPVLGGFFMALKDGLPIVARMFFLGFSRPNLTRLNPALFSQFVSICVWLSILNTYPSLKHTVIFLFEFARIQRMENRCRMCVCVCVYVWLWVSAASLHLFLCEHWVTLFLEKKRSTLWNHSALKIRCIYVT